MIARLNLLSLFSIRKTQCCTKDRIPAFAGMTELATSKTSLSLFNVAEKAKFLIRSFPM